MAAYIAFGIDPKHLLSAVIMTAPGTLLMAKMLVPETEQPRTAGRVVMSEDEEQQEKRRKFVRAISRGTTDGLHLALEYCGHADFFPGADCAGKWHLRRNSSLGELVSREPGKCPRRSVLAVVWLIGIPWHDCTIIGGLLGTRMVLARTA